MLETIFFAVVLIAIDTCNKKDTKHIGEIQSAIFIVRQ